MDEVAESRRGVILEGDRGMYAALELMVNLSELRGKQTPNGGSVSTSFDTDKGSARICFGGPASPPCHRSLSLCHTTFAPRPSTTCRRQSISEATTTSAPATPPHTSSGFPVHFTPTTQANGSPSPQ